MKPESGRNCVHGVYCYIARNLLRVYPIISMPTRVERETPIKQPTIKGPHYEESMKSVSTVATEDLSYAPEIILNGSSNEAVKGERAVMDATDEETFTLDSFDRVIQRAYAQGKAFILARVTTADPHDPQHLYHSYYSAHQINKVLFRTQPELSLLHRMKSNNPLNNMPIIGDVDYYMIDPKSVEKAMKQLHIETKKDDFAKRERSHRAKGHSRTLSDSGYSVKAKQLGNLGEEDQHEANSYQSTIHEIPILEDSTTSFEKPAASTTKKRIQYEANFFATDDDFLMKNEVREIFKRNSINPDDYMLFTLHSNNQMGPNGEIIILQQTPQRPRPRATFSNLFGCINTRPTPALTNRYTGFLTNRGLSVFFLGFIVAAIVTLKFLIPIAYVYLVGFLYAFVFVLVLVLFVEAGPR